MKGIVDLELLFPPPVPGTPHFEEMALHNRNLADFNLKLSVSPELQAVLWEQWYRVNNR